MGSKIIRNIHKFLSYINLTKGVQVNGVAQPVTFTVALAAGASNVMGITVTAVDAAGVTVAAAVPFELWISEAATGIGLTTASASGALAVTGGAQHTAFTAKKHISGITAATGIATLTLTDTNKATGQYVCIKTPFGLVAASAASAGASYGA